MALIRRLCTYYSAAQGDQHLSSLEATCKVVLEIIRAVLFHAVVTFKSPESRAPDSVLLPALHLLSLSLDICC